MSDDVINTRQTIHALISSPLDYCNTLYHDLTNQPLSRLHAIQDAAAHPVTGVYKRGHTSPVLRQLHWLAVPDRVQFYTYEFACLNLKTALNEIPSSSVPLRGHNMHLDSRAHCHHPHPPNSPNRGSKNPHFKFQPTGWRLTKVSLSDILGYLCWW